MLRTFIDKTVHLSLKVIVVHPFLGKRGNSNDHDEEEDDEEEDDDYDDQDDNNNDGEDDCDDINMIHQRIPFLKEQSNPKWRFSKGNALISGKSRLVKYYNLARYRYIYI